MVSIVRSRLNHYEALGVTPTAGGDEIARAFVKVGSVFRPHAFGVLAEVCLAYETLRDPIKRRAYDASLGLEREPNPRNLSPGPRDGSPAQGAMTTAPVDQRAIDTVPPPAPQPNPKPALPLRPEADPKSTPKPHISLGDSTRLTLEDGLAVEVRPIDLRRTGIALSAVLVAACALGGLAGWWSASEVGETPQPERAVSVSLSPAKPLATPAAPQSAPGAAPVRRVADARPARPKPAVTAAARIEPATVISKPAPAEEESQESLPESQPDTSSSGQAADEAPTISTVATPMPLPNRVVARTIERIGYSCGGVVSTIPVEGEAPGVYKVNCSSGQSYQAKPVNGRYHFRRWGRR